MGVRDLTARSIRTLAWLGDAEFELQARLRIAEHGDYPTDRLDAIKARIVRAEGQAALLETIREQLTDDELAVVRRARNATPSSSARGRTRAYRAATGLEALVAIWSLGGAPGRRRFDRVLAPALDQAIEHQVQRTRQRRRR